MVLEAFHFEIMKASIMSRMVMCYPGDALEFGQTPGKIFWTLSALTMACLVR